jgi:uridylate kinase
LKLVIKLGGFLFSPKPRINLIRSYVSKLKGLYEEGHNVVVIVGGGKQARDYIKMARTLGADEASCDQIGINVSRLNAMLLTAHLGLAAYPTPPKSVEEALRALRLGKIVVMGGLTPGHSTDAVAALMAEMLNADVLIRTLDVDGIYTCDPKRRADSKRYEKITLNELYKLLMEGKFWAGTYPLFDLVALKIIERSRIRTYFVDGRDPSNVDKVLKGLPVGTRLVV